MPSDNATPPTVSVVAGDIIRHDRFPTALVEPRNIDVWLPENYPNDAPYAVLYMHDGQMLFDAKTTWNKQEWGVDDVLTQMQQSGLIRPTIVVGIWNSDTGRHADYFPQKPFEQLPPAEQERLYSLERNRNTKLFAYPVRSDNYLKFLVTELKPFIDKAYPTNPAPAATFVAGSSMGGLISMYAICEYPAVFGGAACLSTHWLGDFTTENNPIPAAFQSYLAQSLPNPENHTIYFDYGTATLDQHYEPYQLKVDQLMKKHGFDAQHWQTRKFEGANHSEEAWKARLNIPMAFLLGKK